MRRFAMLFLLVTKIGSRIGFFLSAALTHSQSEMRKLYSVAVMNCENSPHSSKLKRAGPLKKLSGTIILISSPWPCNPFPIYIITTNKIICHRYLSLINH